MLSSGVLLFSGGPVMAQSADSLTVPFQPVFAVSAQIGTDIGGAIPFLFCRRRFFECLSQTECGFWCPFVIGCSSRWSLGANINYKTVAMEADARVTNQKFKGENTVQFYRHHRDVHEFYFSELLCTLIFS